MRSNERQINTSMEREAGAKVEEMEEKPGGADLWMWGRDKNLDS